MKKLCKVPIDLILKFIMWICRAYIRWYFDYIVFPAIEEKEKDDEMEDELLSSIDSR